MIFLNVAILSIMFLLSSGFEVSVNSKKGATFVAFLGSLSLWYMIGLFAYSIYQVTTVYDFTKMINERLDSVIYIIIIFGIINNRIKSRNR